MENVPKKKMKKGGSKGRLLLWLLLTAAVLAAAAHFLRAPQVPKLPETAKKQELLSRAEEDIASVRFDFAGGASYTLIRTGEGIRLLGRESIPLRSDVTDKMLAALSPLAAEEQVLDTLLEPIEKADFLLEPPQLRLTVQYRDGEEKQIDLGAEAADETPQRYCMAAGDSMLYTVLSGEVEMLFHEADYLRDFDQIRVRGDLLDRIDVTGSVDFSIRYTPSGWQMERPFAYPLSALRTDSLLSRMESMGFEACLGSEDEIDLDSLGLANPELTVTWQQAKTVVTGETEDGQTVQFQVPEETHTLLLGHENGQSGVYVWWDHSVFKASNFLFGFWKNLDYRQMLLRQPVNLMINDLNRFILTANGASAVYDVSMVESITDNNQIAKDEYGQVLYDAEIRRDGEKTDPASFLSWYEQWAALAPAGEVPDGYRTGGEAAVQVTLENDALRRTVAFYPYDALHSAMTVDGVCLYYVENTALNALLSPP